MRADHLLLSGREAPAPANQIPDVLVDQREFNPNWASTVWKRMNSKQNQRMRVAEFLGDGRDGEALVIVERDPTLLHVRDKETRLTLMHTAALKNSAEFLVRAIWLGGPVSPRGLRQQTPLHLTTQYECLACAELLVFHGADLDAVDGFGYTPLMYVNGRAGEPIARMLIEHGATLDLNSAIRLNMLEHVREVVISDPQAIRQAPFPRRLLSDAVLVQSIELVQILLECGVDPNDGGNQPPPLFSAVSGNTLSPEIVRLLLEHGADPNAKYDMNFDDQGPQTVMYYEHADPIASEEILAVLREFGAR